MASDHRQFIDHPYLSVVIPCFNEQDGLDESYRRVSAVGANLQKPYEIVYVNDGSKDNTWDKMESLCRLDDRVVVVDLSRNHGKELALAAGLTICRGDRVLMLDVDLQDPPELLPQMLAIMDGGADVVYGQRRRRGGESWFSKAATSLFYRMLVRLTDIAMPRDSGDFRLISRRGLNVLLSMPERHRFVRGMVSWIGFRQEPLWYDRDPRFAGGTKYKFRQKIWLAIDAFTGFSIQPLRFAMALGLFATLCSVALFVYSITSWIVGWSVHVWTSLAGAIFLLGGLQLIVLGILGEYVGRIYEQSQRRPLFLINRIYRGGSLVSSESLGDMLEKRGRD